MSKYIRFLLAYICLLYISVSPSVAGIDDVSETYPFNIETTTNTSAFNFQIGAAGTFYVDWGDGSPVETFVKETPATTYDKETYTITDGLQISHTYTKAKSYTIKIGGTATAYSIYDGENEPAPAISFVGNTHIKNIYGSLGTLFSTLGESDGAQPRFVDTFYGNTNLVDISETLFDGVYGNISWQFRSTFERCPKLTTIPAGIFAHATGGAPQMFRSTFYNDTGLIEIPTGLFQNISTPAEEMFMYTFYGCSKLPDWLPSGLFPNNTDNASDMYYSTFTNNTGDGMCPENMYRDMPIGALWVAPVFCASCPADTISASGSTSIKQCYRGCAKNQYFDIDALECMACPDGSTSDGMIADRSRCQCSAGMYMDTTQYICSVCPAPYSQSVAGAVNETQCYLITTPGEYVVTPREAPVACPIGKYCPGGAKIYYSDARYKPVEWIKSDGASYIDTGIITRPEYEYNLVTTLDGAVANESRVLFGARTNTSDVARCNFFTSTIEGQMRYDRYGSNSKLSPTTNGFINDGDFHEMIMAASGFLYVDDARVSSAMPNSSLGKYNIALFAINTGGVIDFIDDINKIASYKVTDSLTGNIVQNFIPMYDTIDGEYGMYDTISARFFKNAGAGQILGELPDDTDTVAGIFPCPDGYTDRIDTGAIDITNCQVKCSGGTYMPTKNGKCMNVGPGYYSTSHFVNYGDASPDNIRNACPAGLTTIGFGTGADDAADCGRKVHIGDSVLYLRSEKSTSPSLVFDIGNGRKLYADTVQGCRSGHLCAKWTDGKNYAIYNADIEE